MMDIFIPEEPKSGNPAVLGVVDYVTGRHDNSFAKRVEAACEEINQLIGDIRLVKNKETIYNNVIAAAKKHQINPNKLLQIYRI